MFFENSLVVSIHSRVFVQAENTNIFYAKRHPYPMYGEDYMLYFDTDLANQEDGHLFYELGFMADKYAESEERVAQYLLDSMMVLPYSHVLGEDDDPEKYYFCQDVYNRLYFIKPLDYHKLSISRAENSDLCVARFHNGTNNPIELGSFNWDNEIPFVNNPDNLIAQLKRKKFIFKLGDLPEESFKYHDYHVFWDKMA